MDPPVLLPFPAKVFMVKECPSSTSIAHRDFPLSSTAKFKDMELPVLLIFTNVVKARLFNASPSYSKLVQTNIQFQQRWLAVLPGNNPSNSLGLSLVQARGRPSPVPYPSSPSTLPPSPALGATHKRDVLYNITTIRNNS